MYNIFKILMNIRIAFTKKDQSLSSIWSRVWRFSFKAEYINSDMISRRIEAYLFLDECQMQNSKNFQTA